MIKTLKKKFISTAMLVATVLLLAVVIAINVVNVYMHIRQTDATMDVVSRHRDTFTPPRDFNEKRPFMPDMNADTVMSMRYFTVFFDDSGITRVNIDRVSTVTEEEARTFAEEIMSRERRSGFIDTYRYRMTEHREFGGRIVFCDFSAALNNIQYILLITFAVALTVWVVLLIGVTVLASRAISPVVKSIEKQKRFVTNAGHELKTPISIIQSNAEAMELYNGENKWSANIRKQTERLTKLTGELVALARLDEGVTVECDEMNVSAAVLKAADEFKPAAALRGIDFALDVVPNITVSANVSGVSQALCALFDNAVKYASENSTVTVSLKKNARNAEMEICNDCDSLPDADAEKLFERFYRADSARTEEGFGIGLSAARSVCESMGASLDAEYPDEKSIKFRIKFKV